MKNRIFTFLFACAILLAPSFGKAGNDLERDVRRAINRHMIFPAQEAEQMAGVVEVNFTIDEDGTVRVLSIESTNTPLKNYVLSRLERIKLNGNEANRGQTIRYRFVFKPKA
ncbi:MAG: hypothetical protein RL226_1000 [Bacteroidota bacterium]